LPIGFVLDFTRVREGFFQLFQVKVGLLLRRNLDRAAAASAPGSRCLTYSPDTLLDVFNSQTIY
jgi:hypothetical protein